MEQDRAFVTGFNAFPIAAAPGEEERIGFTVTALGPALLVSLAGIPIVVTVDLDLADDEVAIGGPDVLDARRLFRGVDDGGGRNIQETIPMLLGPQGRALGKVDGTARLVSDVGVSMFAVRNDVAGSLVALDGEYSPTQVDAFGALRVGGFGPTHLGKSLGVVFAGGDVGVPALGIRVDAGGPLGANLAYQPTLLDSEGNTRVGGATPLALGKAEDVAAADADVGVPAYLVRRDVPAANAADGDYMPSIGDAAGATWIRERKPGTVPLGTAIAVVAAEITTGAANPDRFTVTFINNSAVTIFIGPTGVTIANGAPILSGASITLEATIEWFAIAAVAGPSDLRVLEQSY